MTKKFSKTEQDLIRYFSSLNRFEHNGKIYFIKCIGKPTIPKGEPKTDIYLGLVDENKKEVEYKISLKMQNADFLENKIRLERALEILGINAQKIIQSHCLEIRDEFQTSQLIDFSSNNRAKSPLITLGWKFEMTNKKSGNKSRRLNLTNTQKLEVFSGSFSKKNQTAKVNGKLIRNSGIANYFFGI